MAFGCFSAAAIVAKRREFLYLGGLLSSGLSILIWLMFASSIFGSTAMYSFEVIYCFPVFRHKIVSCPCCYMVVMYFTILLLFSTAVLRLDDIRGICGV